MMELMHVAMVAAGVVTAAHVGYRWLSYEGTKIDKLKTPVPEVEDKPPLVVEPEPLLTFGQPKRPSFVNPTAEQMRQYVEILKKEGGLKYKGNNLRINKLVARRSLKAKMGRKVELVTTFGGASFRPAPADKTKTKQD